MKSSDMLKDIYKFYDKPKNPTIYTGLFQKRSTERTWSDRPNKTKGGVSYTLYAETMDIPCGDTPLFRFFHGLCWTYAKFFQMKNPSWKIVSMIRDTFWQTNVHTYCIKRTNGKLLFADARGITDDPEEFFKDFRFSKNVHIEEETEIPDKNQFTKDYQVAYDLIYHPDTAEKGDNNVRLYVN